MQLNFKKLNAKATLPVYATDGAAGMDLYACLEHPVMLDVGESAAVPTGLAMELPDGYSADIRGRSGLAFKHAVVAFHGLIDSDYRDEIKVMLTNHSRMPFIIEPGMRIAQLTINISSVKCRPTFVEKLSETKRNGGFGSTGLNADPRLHKKSDFGYVDAKEVMYEGQVDQDKIKSNLLSVVNPVATKGI